MKLVSLYIENFGGLHQYALDFESGLTVIRKENGFGKSTLAEFIRAMFYGFPRKGKTLDKSRRQKYTPWNGGTFGGNLVFEVDGNRYRVERTFGATPKGDSFTLIDLTTNRKSTRYGEELGLELFQLDGDSFERSTYLPQLSDGQALTTDSIRSKLSNLVEDTNDVGNFEKAMAALKTKRSAFVAYRGSSGSVAQASAQVTRLQEQLQNAENLEQPLKSAEELLENIKKQSGAVETRQEALRQELRRASEAAATAAVHNQYRQLAERLRRTEEERRVLEEKYPVGFPAGEETEAARQAVSQMEILKNRELTQQEDLDAVAFADAHRERFEKHIPSQGELAACRSKCESISDLREESVELAAELTRQPPVRANPWPLVVLAVLGVAGVIAGIFLMLNGKAVWSYGALCLGIFLLIDSVLAAVRLAKARKKLQQFHQEQLQTRKKLEAVSGKVDQLTKAVEAFLGAYVALDGSDLFGLLAELEHDSEDYLRAVVRVSQWHEDLEAHEGELARWNDALNRYFERCGLSRQPDVDEQLLQIRDDRKQWEELCRDESREKAELESFRQENAQTLAQPLPDGVDVQALHREEEELARKQSAFSEELLRLQQLRDRLAEQVQQIPQIRDELCYWQEKKAADQKNADLLDDTMAYLEQAKENLSGSYLGPIRRSFEIYLNRLWQDQEGHILVTPDLDVQLERYGQARELGYFSAGQTDTVMLCMRLALVDALFAEEKPFVILDDPFVNLDDDRTKEALELLKVLSQDRQILYLTCNSSRAPQ